MSSSVRLCVALQAVLLDDLDLWVREENRLNFEWEEGLNHLFKLLAQRFHGENPDNIDIGGLDTIYDLKGVATWLGAGLDQLFYLALLGMGETGSAGSVLTRIVHLLSIVCVVSWSDMTSKL